MSKWGIGFVQGLREAAASRSNVPAGFVAKCKFPFHQIACPQQPDLVSCGYFSTQNIEFIIDLIKNGDRLTYKDAQKTPGKPGPDPCHRGSCDSSGRSCCCCCLPPS